MSRNIRLTGALWPRVVQFYRTADHEPRQQFAGDWARSLGTACICRGTQSPLGRHRFRTDQGGDPRSARLVAVPRAMHVRETADPVSGPPSTKGPFSQRIHRGGPFRCEALPSVNLARPSTSPSGGAGVGARGGRGSPSSTGSQARPGGYEETGEYPGSRGPQR